jgi:hypothetical protein
MSGDREALVAPSSPARSKEDEGRKKYFSDESVFEFIWNEADGDGIWVGDAATLAEEFGVS